jgi:predicted DNA-binding transcriptional regulator YafY
MVDKLERMVNLLCYLYSSSGDVSIERIGKEVNGYKDCPSTDALRQQLHRDRKELKEIGIEIKCDSEGYTYSISRVLFPDESALELNPEEKSVLIELLRGMLSLYDLPNYQNLKYAVLTYAAHFKILSKVIEEDPLLDFSLTISKEEEELFEKLNESISQRKKISFDYWPINRRKPSKYTVKPLKIAFRDGEWYLAGMKEENEPRLFKLKRISNLEILDKQFCIDEEISETIERLRNRPWEYEEEPAQVLIEADRDVAELLIRRFKGTIECENSGKCLLRLSVKSETRFIQEFSQFIFSAKIVEPEELKDKVRKMIKDALEGL